MHWQYGQLDVGINASPQKSESGLTPSKSKQTDNGKGYLLRVVSPLSVQEKLWIKFRKSLRKGYAKNIGGKERSERTTARAKRGGPDMVLEMGNAQQ